MRPWLKYFGIAAALVLALALRWPESGCRPMHNDEAVNAIKFRDLYEHGAYKYDPNEYHGPTLEYFTLAWAKLTGAPDFNDFDEARFRFVTILFGVGLILLLPLVADGLGRGATVWAAMLTAVSPAMVFYSRYYIHEMLLVFFTFLALTGGWRYWRSRKIGWALITGAALGLMQATKETFVLALAAAAAALAMNSVWGRNAMAGGAPAGVEGLEGKRMDPGPRRILEGALAALAAWLGVALVLFTSFFKNATGMLDSIRTYLPWLHRNAGASPHIHAWNFYLERLAFFHLKSGPVWSEGLILGLAILGAVVALRRAGSARDRADRTEDEDEDEDEDEHDKESGRGRVQKGSDGPHAGFVRFIVFYTVGLTVLYSLLAYKTPWCMLGFLHGMILLAGVGVAGLLEWVGGRWLKIGIVVGLLAGTGQLAVRAWQASTTYCADRSNPYVYAQTSPDLLNLVEEVEAVAKAQPQGWHTAVQVMAPEGDYWPLPWYLRRFDHVGWWPEIPPDPYAPMMIVSAKFKAALDEKKTHLMAGYFELRPGVFLELYVERNLWQAYLDGRPKDSP